MTKPRGELVDLEVTPWYHCVSRCVRQSWLCGVDPATGRDYSHRKKWIAQRLRQLASVFAIGVAGYAVMDNHYHVVLRVDRALAEGWDLDEVFARWGKVFSVPPFILEALGKHRSGERVEPGVWDTVLEVAEVYRKRLYDISWFMRVLNESIARMANKEDGVKGRFWQGRFKSQAITDETALVAVLAYVDLNPVRAGVVDRVEDARHTSLRARLEGRGGRLQPDKLKTTWRPEVSEDAGQEESTPLAFEFMADQVQAPLIPFADESEDSGLPVDFPSYLELVDFLARAVHPTKRGHTPADLPPIMDRLGFSSTLVEYMTEWSDRFGYVIGRAGFHKKGASLNRRLFDRAA